MEVVGDEADVDVRLGDGDADFILDGGDRLSKDRQSAECSDRVSGSAGLGRGVLEALSQESLEVVAGVDTFGVGDPVDGHGEPVTTGVDNPADHGLEFGGAALGVVRPASCGVDGPAESVLVVVVGSFESGQAGDVGVDGGLLQDERVSGGERFDLGERQRLVADVVDER